MCVLKGKAFLPTYRPSDNKHGAWHKDMLKYVGSQKCFGGTDALFDPWKIVNSSSVFNKVSLYIIARLENRCLDDECYPCSGPIIHLHFHKGKLVRVFKFTFQELNTNCITVEFEQTEVGKCLGCTWNLLALTELLLCL